MVGIIGTEELRPVNEFIKNEKLPKGINTSHVTLIPKCKSPNSFADYKPISMIHGLYKIVAKLFSARLKQTIYICPLLPLRIRRDSLLVDRF
jgi:hypothetical protein